MVRIIISGFKSFDEQITSTRGQYFSRNLVYQAYMQDMEFTSQVPQLPEASGLGNLTKKTLHWFGFDMMTSPALGWVSICWVCVCNGRKILEMKNSFYGVFPKWGDVYLPGVLRPK